ncbi:vWA domain-containing protein [Sansalvadorimonas verongulae]|uniref:vWA domain-containing protein n=1 Tax=Sansalvadorimonas verongulae TaxID=2172824 RepID=UPI0012BC8758|nr:VWA domain-containing protein [Sansalvadorimonas verongulae]MTI15566.1 hypothetical protein [Sansalvadorimonas verongulae]
MRQPQQGIAIILFLLLLPVIFGLMVLGIEGGHKLRDKARLGDAVEVAALAMSARPPDTPEQNRKLVKSIINTMVSDLNNVSVSLHTVACPDNPDCNHTDSSKKFTEYQLKVSGAHRNWLGQETPLGFNSAVTLGSKATARKNHGEAIDVFFVADFSSSMGGPWRRVIKIDMLKGILTQAAHKLEGFTRLETDPQKKNTIALIPFSLSTYEYVPGMNESFAVNNIHTLWPLRSLPDLLVEKEPDTSDPGSFHTIHPTTSAQKIEDKLKAMKPHGATASFEGIIRAAQLALKTNNAKRLIIVLTDGEDSYKDIHQQLVEHGYCKTLTSAVEQQRTPSGERVKLDMAVISFSYDVAGNTGLVGCVGKNKVFSAEDPDAISDIISALFAEEVGHIYSTAR